MLYFGLYYQLIVFLVYHGDSGYLDDVQKTFSSNYLTLWNILPTLYLFWNVSPDDGTTFWVRCNSSHLKHVCLKEAMCLHSDIACRCSFQTSICASFSNIKFLETACLRHDLMNIWCHKYMTCWNTCSLSGSNTSTYVY